MASFLLQTAIFQREGQFGFVHDTECLFHTTVFMQCLRQLLRAHSGSPQFRNHHAGGTICNRTGQSGSSASINDAK